MTSRKHWLLPDGVDELLPERAKALEQLRRRLLDCCDGWGYRYVIPPLVEFTDSLLVGLGADLDLVTCKFADRLSGRTLGVSFLLFFCSLCLYLFNFFFGFILTLETSHCR